MVASIFFELYFDDFIYMHTFNNYGQYINAKVKSAPKASFYYHYYKC